MNEKIASFLLICMVALSIVYGCSSIALSSHVTISIDHVLSRPTTVTGENRQNAKISYLGPNTDILGDPVNNPRPQDKTPWH